MKPETILGVVVEYLCCFNLSSRGCFVWPVYEALQSAHGMSYTVSTRAVFGYCVFVLEVTVFLEMVLLVRVTPGQNSLIVLFIL